MSGHSKWANIKHRKGNTDKIRGALFSRLSKEIMAAVRIGGADIHHNVRLKLAITKAKSNNMPKDTIERAVKKGSGNTEASSYEDVIYEVFATGGAALIVESLTDKKSRTTPEIKSILTKHNATLAENNAVLHLFERKGRIRISSDQITEEKLMDILVDVGAEDIYLEGDFVVVLTKPEDYPSVSEEISKHKISTVESEIAYLPMKGSKVNLEDSEQIQKILKLIQTLEDHEDVQNVHTNLASLPAF